MSRAISPEDPYWRQAISWEESVEQSVIPAQLIIYYAATHYRVWTGATRYLTLSIGHYCAPLATLLHTSGSWSAAYITAYNPYSQAKLPAENQCANIRLYERLAWHITCIYRGESIDPAGKWPAEAGFLALALDCATAKTLGREFGQNAIVWIDTDIIPRLILLR
jgi:hypothetical protein